MRNVFWLVEGRLAGRAGPEVAPWDLAAIRDAGFTAVLSTEEACQAKLIKDEGLRHLEHFMPQAYPTTPALVGRFVGMVRAAAVDALAELRGGGCLLVHCYAGRDRTGLVLCAVLMELEGLSAADALKRVRKARPSALTGPGVTDVLAEYEIRLKADAFDD
ncbi:MAG: dual specificity protein phosphatase family protein [Deltaproteobacteria bacterium]|nr:dual specificity protein phosphatase family protein [Deltaproteobacteria bacterium]